MRYIRREMPRTDIRRYDIYYPAEMLSDRVMMRCHYDTRHTLRHIRVTILRIVLHVYATLVTPLLPRYHYYAATLFTITAATILRHDYTPLLLRYATLMAIAECIIYY